jgi:hypothetical protein
MKKIQDKDAAERLLNALGEQLAVAKQHFEIVVIGGSGLLALGVVQRTTRDVDIVALRSDSELRKPAPLPEALRIARDRVARDFSLPKDWLIHFKLYAAVDQGPGKHSEDLEALAPTHEELLRAARWARTHDPSPEFEQELRRALAHFGVDDGDL